MKVAFVIDDIDTSPWKNLIDSRASEMIRALEELEQTVQIVPRSRLLREPQAALNEIERFQPELITAPNFNLLLIGAYGIERLLNLDVPTLNYWDDPIGALVIYMNCDPHRWNEPDFAQIASAAKKGTGPLKSQVLSPFSRLADWCSSQQQRWGWRRRGPGLAPERFRRLLSNPRLIHLSWDSGHMEAFTRLGLARPEQVHWHPIATFAPFLAMGDRAGEVAQTTDVAFCGNIYLGEIRQSAYWKDDRLRGAAEHMVARKLTDLGQSNWRLFLEELDDLPPRVRERLGLYPDRRGFWEYYLFTVWNVMSTLPRLEVFRRIRHKVRLFGLFSDQSSRELLQEFGNLEFARELGHFNELPRQFAATKVNICISNGLIYQGTPSKLIDCLASGGFALCDPKPDLVRLFGPKVEAIFCPTPDILNAKLEYYLARPAERREIVEELRKDIKRHCTLQSLYRYGLDLVRKQHTNHPGLPASAETRQLPSGNYTGTRYPAVHQGTHASA
jgi:hypothetical protein